MVGYITGLLLLLLLLLLELALFSSCVGVCWMRCFCCKSAFCTIKQVFERTVVRFAGFAAGVLKSCGLELRIRVNLRQEGPVNRGYYSGRT